MILEATPNPPNQDELLKHLRTFLAGAGVSTRGQVNPQLSTTALHLLTQLPAAREAVLEYFGSVLDGIVSRYNPIQDRDGGNTFNEDEEIILADLSRVLSSLVTSCPSPWAPIVSTWSLECLGKLSTKWSSKICGKQGQQLLHEKLSAWLGCNAARVLLDLAADCLAKLMDSKVDTKMDNMVDNMMSDTESCVAGLLETSVKHAPHFDWVVAHIGSCFPHTVTHRVLSVGLKDFIAANKEADGEVSLSKMPRFLSVVSILTHLATTHQTDLQTAVHSLLSSSLTTSTPSTTHIATVPFLLSLSSMSAGVRRALTTDLARLLTPLLDRIPVLYPSWTTLYFPTPNSLLINVTQLLLSTDRDGSQLLLLLLHAGAEQGTVATPARTIMNSLLADLHTQVHTMARHRIEEVAIFSGLAAQLPTLQRMMLVEDNFQLSSSVQLLGLYCLHKGRSSSAQLLKFLLSSCEREQQLVVVVQLVNQLEQFHYNMVGEAISTGLRDKRLNMKLFLTNITKLTQLESGNCHSWVKAVRNYQEQLVEQIARPELTGLVLDLFRLVQPDHTMRVSTLHKICHWFVQVILATVTSTNLTTEAIAARVSSCEKILLNLCQQHCGLQISLRFLLDSCLNSPYCAWLGGIQNPDESSVRQKTVRFVAQLIKGPILTNYTPGSKLAARQLQVWLHAGPATRVLNCLPCWDYRNWSSGSSCRTSCIGG